MLTAVVPLKRYKTGGSDAVVTLDVVYQPPKFTDLEDALLLKIFCYIDFRDRVRVEGTCRVFRAVLRRHGYMDVAELNPSVCRLSFIRYAAAMADKYVRNAMIERLRSNLKSFELSCGKFDGHIHFAALLEFIRQCRCITRIRFKINATNLKRSWLISKRDRLACSVGAAANGPRTAVGELSVSLFDACGRSDAGASFENMVLIFEMIGIVAELGTVTYLDMPMTPLNEWTPFRRMDLFSMLNLFPSLQHFNNAYRWSLDFCPPGPKLPSTVDESVGLVEQLGNLERVEIKQPRDRVGDGRNEFKTPKDCGVSSVSVCQMIESNRDSLRHLKLRRPLVRRVRDSSQARLLSALSESSLVTLEVHANWINARGVETLLRNFEIGNIRKSLEVLAVRFQGCDVLRNRRWKHLCSLRELVFLSEGDKQSGLIVKRFLDDMESRGKSITLTNCCIVSEAGGSAVRDELVRRIPGVQFAELQKGEELMGGRMDGVRLVVEEEENPYPVNDEAFQIPRGILPITD